MQFNGPILKLQRKWSVVNPVPGVHVFKKFLSSAVGQNKLECFVRGSYIRDSLIPARHLVLL